MKKVEKIWPNEESFTQEGILGILMENKFDCEFVLQLLTEKNEIIIQKIKGKSIQLIPRNK